MDDLIRGPLLALSVAAFVAGLIFRTIRLFLRTNQNSVMVKQPIVTVVSTVFHACLLVTPIFLMAHNLILHRYLGIRLPCIPDRLADVATVLVLGCAIFFLVRLLAVPKVAAVSSIFDYMSLFITVIPFLTGFLAYHQFLFDAKLISTLHICTGELMLVAVPYTKAGPVELFVFARLTAAGVYCLGRCRKAWRRFRDLLLKKVLNRWM